MKELLKEFSKVVPWMKYFVVGWVGFTLGMFWIILVAQFLGWE